MQKILTIKGFTLLSCKSFRFFVLNDLKKKNLSSLIWNAAAVVTFAARFIRSNQPHLALHLVLLSLAEFTDCSELLASLCLIPHLLFGRNTQERPTTSATRIKAIHRYMLFFFF